MICHDASAALARVSWSEQQLPLAQLLGDRQLPLLVRVVKGQYLDLVPRGSSESGTVPSGVFLLISGGRSQRFIAQGIKFKDTRRFVTVGRKLLVPSSFEGLFEILSEGGKCVRPIESVVELAQRFPDSCIVRENCKAFVSKSNNIDSITDRTRTILTGETLVLVGEVAAKKCTRSTGEPMRFLRCFDSAGENVYLSYDMKVRFSAVAKEDSISGVHSTSNLLKKRLPLNVRLVNSRSSNNSRSSRSGHSSDLRVHSMYEDEVIVAVPTSKPGSDLVVMPASARLDVQMALNMDDVLAEDFFKQLCQRSTQLWSESADHVHPFEVEVPRADLLSSAKCVVAVPVLRPKVGGNLPRATRRRSGEIVDEYDEIDQIYDYVRGFAPLPKNLRSNRKVSGQNTAASPSNDIENKPEPPPIETIPSRRVLNHDKSISVHPAVYVANISKTDSKKPTCKRTHQTSLMETKMAQNSDTKQKRAFNKYLAPKHRPRFFWQKSASPLKNCGIYYLSHNSIHESSTPSALFGMRYKSLTNLMIDPSNTLNSSHSGDKTSGESGDSSGMKTSMPEKKPKKVLGRPRSMSNLLWSPLYQAAVESCTKPDLIMEQDRRARLDSGEVKKRLSAGAANDRFPVTQRKLGTLYL